METVGTGGDYKSSLDANIRNFTATIWDGALWATSFQTITPPNGPSCIRSGNLGALMAPTSNHSGGVNAALGDGAVRFISDTIDIGNENFFGGAAAGVNALGKSPFGVWGAIGSRAGGESTTL